MYQDLIHLHASSGESSATLDLTTMSRGLCWVFGKLHSVWQRLDSAASFGMCSRHVGSEQQRSGVA